MATKTKTPKNITIAPEGESPSLFVRGVTKADGSPWGTRRSNEDMLAHYEAKLVKRKADHAKELAGIEKKIAYFKNGPTTRSKAIDPVAANAAAQEYLGKGMTSDQILAYAEQLRLAAYAVKGKSPEEVAAIANAPAFFAVTDPAAV